MRSLGIALLGILVSGCMSMSTYQTAETTDPGKLSLGISVSYLGIRYTYQDSLGNDSTQTEIYPGMGEIMGRYGINKFMDVGIKYTIPFTTFLDLKFQILDQDRGAPLFLAVDIGGSFYALGEYFGGFLYPAIIVSYRAGGIHPYLTAKGAYLYGNFSMEDLELDQRFWPGVAAGVKFGNKVWLIPEISFYTIEGDEIYQGGLAFGLTYGD